MMRGVTGAWSFCLSLPPPLAVPWPHFQSARVLVHSEDLGLGDQLGYCHGRLRGDLFTQQKVHDWTCVGRHRREGGERRARRPGRTTSAEEVASRIGVRVPLGTSILEITTEAATPSGTKQMSDAVTQNLIRRVGAYEVLSGKDGPRTSMVVIEEGKRPLYLLPASRQESCSQRCARSVSRLRGSVVVVETVATQKACDRLTFRHGAPRIRRADRARTPALPQCREKRRALGMTPDQHVSLRT